MQRTERETANLLFPPGEYKDNLFVFFILHTYIWFVGKKSFNRIKLVVDLTCSTDYVLLEMLKHSR